MKGLFVASIGFVFFAMPASAGIVSAQLSVNGLSCPFCVFGIEKKLLDVPGVLEVEVFLDEGRIALTFERESQATVKELEYAVGKAGFELVGLILEARGKVQRADEGDFRLFAHPGMTFRLAERVDGHELPISSETLQRLQGVKTSDVETFVLRGVVEERDSREPLLIIREREAVPGPMN